MADVEIDIEALRDVEAMLAKKKLRRDRPWTYDIIKALWGSWLTMDQLLRQLAEMRDPAGLPKPRKFYQAVPELPKSAYRAVVALP